MGEKEKGCVGIKAFDPIAKVVDDLFSSLQSSLGKNYVSGGHVILFEICAFSKMQLLNAEFAAFLERRCPKTQENTNR